MVQETLRSQRTLPQGDTILEFVKPSISAYFLIDIIINRLIIFKVLQGGIKVIAEMEKFRQFIGMLVRNALDQIKRKEAACKPANQSKEQ